ncbi:MAG: amidohydrolase [Erysipelotrichaceae bacterium]|jgi:amidohydrolase|nr:amidohydrolase [Erysipelotrichaceae bacterium]
MSLNEKIKELAKKYESYMIAERHHFHEYPEVGLKEFETSKRLKEACKELGLPLVEGEGTGFIAIYDTGKPGKTLAIRTDIDALPMKEDPNNLVGPKKVVSKLDDACHSCGHDAHMAMELAAIKILLDLKDELSGKILFCFEAAEEFGGGYEEMAKLLVPLKPDAIYGSHVTAFMKSKTVCLDGGPRMGGSMLIDITVQGKGGHGSRPDLSINPLFAAAAIVTQLGNNWANRIDVTKTVTLGIAQLHCGTADNIFAETAKIGGTCRFFDMEEAEKAAEILRRVPDLVAQANYCTVSYGPRHATPGGPVINDDKLAALARKGAREILGDEGVVEGVLWFASEPFSRYGTLLGIPSVFAFVGIGNEELGSGAEHHNNRFDIDDDALLSGVLATCKFATEFLA